MLTSLKDYCGHLFLGKRLHFTCNCLIPLDITGVVVDYKIEKHSTCEELVFFVSVNDKIIKIGENHPDLFIEDVE